MRTVTAHGLRQDPAFWIVIAAALLIVTPFALWFGVWGALVGPRPALEAGWTLRGVFVLGLAALALVFVAKAVSMTPTPVLTAGLPPQTEPRAILDARYAKGEITRDEYLRMRADLEGPAH